MLKSAVEIEGSKKASGPSNTMASESTYFIAHEMSINSVHSKPTENLEAQMQWYEHEEHTKSKTNIILQDEVKIYDEYPKYCEDFLAGLSKLEVQA